MAKLRPEEEWACRVVSQHLGRTVDAHDDNSAPGMFDLRVGPAHAPEMAIEVTGAIDSPYTETWIAGQRRSGQVAGVIGEWIVLLRPGARVKRVKAELPVILTAITAAGRDTLTVARDAFYEPQLCALLGALGIQRVSRLRPDGDGKLWFLLDGDGGFTDSARESVPGWLSDFLMAEERADVLRKLTATTAPRREVFVVVDVKGAPWSVVSYLTEISPLGEPLPPAAPLLPDPVTGIWLASTLSFTSEYVGVHWDGTHWSSFQSRRDGID